MAKVHRVSIESSLQLDPLLSEGNALNFRCVTSSIQPMVVMSSEVAVS